MVDDEYLILRAPITTIKKLGTHIKKYCFKRKAELNEIDQNFDHLFLYVCS